MKQTTFYIVLNLRTCTGYESFGKFSIGDNRRIATDIFNRLKGSQTVNDRSNIQLDLTEMVNGLPVNVQMISCSLDELAENCKYITIETFRLLNLKAI